jgi:MoaA/NifB/PqqE/SkfB family radical SAM enzyme
MAPRATPQERGRIRRAAAVWSDYRANRVTRSRPIILMLSPTTRCNAACSFCLDFPRDAPRTLSAPEFRVLLDKLAPGLEMVEFAFFGEPLLHPGLPELIGAARGRGLATTLYTNGKALDAPIAAALGESGIDLIVVNLNAWLPGFALSDPSDVPDAAVEALRLLTRACAGGKATVVVQVLTKSGRAEFDARAVARRFDPARGALFRIKAEERFAYDGPETARGPLRCHRLFQEIAVTADGEVAVCCKDMLRRTTFGNLLTEDLDEIWVRRMNPFRRDNTSPLCRRCEVRGNDAAKLLANALLSPLTARRLYLRGAAWRFRGDAPETLPG